MKYLALLLGLLLAGMPNRTAAEVPSLLSTLDKEVADLAARALPGVVRIRTRRQQEAPRVRQGIIQGQGFSLVRTSPTICGFVWDADGHLVAADVPEGNDPVRVILHDDGEVDAKVVGKDPFSRLCVLQVAVQGLAPLPLGDAGALRRGSWAMVLAGTATSQPAPYPVTVAGSDETLADAAGVVLSLAGTAPPATGAPVLNARGEVVGILLSSSRTPHEPGRMVALPIQAVQAIVEQLKKGQPIKRGFLGVMIADLTPELAKLANLEAGAGVFVQDVTEKGPAAVAGLQPEDVILSVNGTPVRTPAQLRVAATALEPGKEAGLQIWRKKEKLELKVTVGEMPVPQRRAEAQPGIQYTLPQQNAPLVQGRVFVAPPVTPPSEKMVTLDFQAAGLLEAIVRVLNGSGYPFAIEPTVLKDAEAMRKPFGVKATNTPLSQVLDQLCAHYGLAWHANTGVVTLRRKG